MNKIQIVQYVAAVAAILSAVLSDPEVTRWLLDHPLVAGGMLSAPSTVTLLRSALRAVAKLREPAGE